MSPDAYTLDDLVRATGFTKRQIRFYITKRLAPGAGDRGPNAMYGEETLRRLRLVALLKAKTIAPTGRAMTLDEIGHAMDSLSDDGIEALIAGHTELTIVDTEGGAVSPPDSAREFLARMRVEDDPPRLHLAQPMPDFYDSRLPFDEFAGVNLDRKTHLSDYDPRGGEDPEQDSLSDLLGRLQSTLAELGSDTRFTATARDGEQWLRVTTPDVEFHVRKPDDQRARLRLIMLAQQLGRLLAREE